MRPAWLLALFALLWQAMLPALATAGPGPARVLQVDVCSASGRWRMEVDFGPSRDADAKALHAERHAPHCGACGAMAAAPPAAPSTVSVRPAATGARGTLSVPPRPRMPALLPEARGPPRSAQVA